MIDIYVGLGVVVAAIIGAALVVWRFYRVTSTELDNDDARWDDTTPDD